MKLSKNLIGVVLSTTLLSTPIYANSTTKIEDTFLIENIENTFKMYRHSYIITNTNSVKASGFSLYGTSIAPGGNSTDWGDVRYNVLGDKLDNIVRIEMAGNNNITMLNSDGEVLSLGYTVNTDKTVDTYNVPKKINIPERAVEIDVLTNSSNPLTLCIVTEDGKAYMINTSYSEKIELNNGNKIIKMLPTTSTHAYILDEAGNMYNYDIKTESITEFEIDGSAIKGVKSFYRLNSGNQILIESKAGNISVYTPSTGKIDIVKFKKDNQYVNVIPSQIMYDNEYYMVYLKTQMGTFELDARNAASGAVYKNLPFTPVAYEYNNNTANYPTEAFITNDSKLMYKGNNINNELGKVSSTGTWTEIPLDWLNDNPVLERDVITNIKILHDSVLDRTKEKDIEFSMVFTKQPTAFNIYYAKSKDLHKKDMWEIIQENIPVDSLQSKHYDTGFVDGSGNNITGKTFTYRWELPQEDLTNIQLIIEPIY